MVVTLECVVIYPTRGGYIANTAEDQSGGRVFDSRQSLYGGEKLTT